MDKKRLNHIGVDASSPVGVAIEEAIDSGRMSSREETSSMPNELLLKNLANDVQITVGNFSVSNGVDKPTAIRVAAAALQEMLAKEEEGKE